MTEFAVKKLDAEQKAFKGDKYGKAVYKEVADKLRRFARQDAEFAQAICQTDKTLSDCCKEIMQGCGSSISDVEVFSRAAAFYFPGARVAVQMTIDLCGSVRGEQDTPEPVPIRAPIVVDLFDLL